MNNVFMSLSGLLSCVIVDAVIVLVVVEVVIVNVDDVIIVS